MRNKNGILRGLAAVGPLLVLIVAIARFGDVGASGKELLSGSAAFTQAPPNAAFADPVIGWGGGIGAPPTTIPAGLEGVTAIAAGDPAMALKSDGTVVVWGDNGQIQPPAGLSGVTAIASGWGHAVALKSDGTVVAWGANTSGQTSVPVGLSSVIAIAAGGGHTVALKSDGTVVAWGHNHRGQVIGCFPGVPNPIVCPSIPSAVANPVTLNGTVLGGVTAISAGRNHTVVLKNDGTVLAWGEPFDGQTTVPLGLTGVMAISAGGRHTMVLKDDGTVTIFGKTTYTAPSTTMPAGLSGVVAISAGYVHNVALKSDGTVVAWGFNGAGETDVPVGLVDVAAISAGTYSLALVSLAPTDKDQCKNGGWAIFTNPRTFTNQGDCIQFVNTGQ